MQSLLQRDEPEAVRSRSSAILSVVVPTFNERTNLAKLIALVEAALRGIDWEIIVVDDNSPDGTAALAKELGQADPRIRCLRRVNRRGLAGACIEGMLSSAAPYVAVIDADLQHDAAILPQMLQRLVAGETDLVIGSRHVEGGSAEAGFSQQRGLISRVATEMARLTLKAPIRDPMSGYFMIRRAIVEELAPRLTSSGFKILADIVASSPHPLRYAEIGYCFREREAGCSKLDAKVILDFVGLMLNKATGNLIPVRFVFFGAVGAIGVVLHLAVLWAALKLGMGFSLAQTAATIAAMTSNFFANNFATYRDAQLKGWGRMLRGLLLFYAVCSLGAVASVGIATLIFQTCHIWWLAGLAGIVMGSVWNYALSSAFVWKGAS